MNLRRRLFVRSAATCAVLLLAAAAPSASALASAPAVVPSAEPLATTPLAGPAASLLSTPLRWFPPVGITLTVSGRYRAPPDPYSSGHRGIDLPAQLGTVVVAPVSGTVTFAGTVVDRGVLTIRFDDSSVVSVEPITSPLRSGDPVQRGSRIGSVTGGGHCGDGISPDSCLHLGVRVDGDYVNPLRYFFDRAELLPW